MFEDDKVIISESMIMGSNLALNNLFVDFDDTFRLTHAKDVIMMRKLTLVTENVEVVTSKVSSAHRILDRVAMLLPTGIKSGSSLVDSDWLISLKR